MGRVSGYARSVSIAAVNVELNISALMLSCRNVAPYRNGARWRLDRMKEAQHCGRGMPAFTTRGRHTRGSPEGIKGGAFEL